MRTMRALFVAAVLGLLCCSALFAFTLSFDDVASGSDLQYYRDLYGASFSQGFVAQDHTASSWGVPHSPPNVLVWTWDTHPAMLLFGNGTLDSSGTIPHYSISSLSAYFSTAQHILVTMTGYREDAVWGNISVGTRLIGDEWGYWDNVSIELRAEDGGVIDYVVFEGVASSAARLGFCADDMTIEPVPEPSTLSFLSLALAGVGVGRLRRRRAA